MYVEHLVEKRGVSWPGRQPDHWRGWSWVGRGWAAPRPGTWPLDRGDTELENWLTDFLLVLFRYSELVILAGVWVSLPRYRQQNGSYTLHPPLSSCSRHADACTPPLQTLLWLRLYWEHKTTTFLDFEIFQCFTIYIVEGLISVMEKKILCWCSNAVLCVVVFSPDILDCGKNSRHVLPSDCSSSWSGQDTKNRQRIHLPTADCLFRNFIAPLKHLLHIFLYCSCSFFTLPSHNIFKSTMPL